MVSFLLGIRWCCRSINSCRCCFNKALRGRSGLSWVPGLRHSLLWVAVSSCTPFLWGNFSERYGAVLVAVGAPGCPNTSSGQLCLGAAPPGVGECPGCCPGGGTLLRHGSRHFPGESKSRLAIPCSARKAPAADTGRNPLLLVWLLAVQRAAKILHVAGVTHGWGDSAAVCAGRERRNGTPV